MSIDGCGEGLGAESRHLRGEACEDPASSSGRNYRGRVWVLSKEKPRARAAWGDRSGPSLPIAQLRSRHTWGQQGRSCWLCPRHPQCRAQLRPLVQRLAGGLPGKSQTGREQARTSGCLCTPAGRDKPPRPCMACPPGLTPAFTPVAPRTLLSPCSCGVSGYPESGL